MIIGLIVYCLFQIKLKHIQLRSLVFFLLTMIYIPSFVLSDTIDCIDDQSCSSQTLVCATAGNCIFNCIGRESCAYSNLYCPEDNAWDCTINVGATYALTASQIFGQTAKQLIIENVPANGLFYTHIYCPVGGLCYYQSDAGSGCYQCNVWGYTGTDIELIGNNVNTFYYGDIYAQNANSLTITTTNDVASFFTATIYCPTYVYFLFFVIFCVIFVLFLCYFDSLYCVTIIGSLTLKCIDAVSFFNLFGSPGVV